MKNFLIFIITVIFLYSCASTNVVEVENREATTVDITQSDSSKTMSNVGLDLGEPEIKIFFGYDEDTLSEESLVDLLEISRVLKDNDRYTLLVEGHADERGTREYNLALSERRAKAVEDFLVSAGIIPVRIEVVGYGEEQPSDISSDENAWSKNRRAELFFVR